MWINHHERKKGKTKRECRTPNGCQRARLLMWQQEIRIPGSKKISQDYMKRKSITVFRRQHLLFTSALAHYIEDPHSRQTTQLSPQLFRGKEGKTGQAKISKSIIKATERKKPHHFQDCMIEESTHSLGSTCASESLKHFSGNQTYQIYALH